MRKSLIAVLFSLVSLMTLSCNKADQLFNNGEPVTEQRSVDQYFDAISVYNNVNVRLVRDGHPRLELTCPENLIESIITEVNGNTLVIKNENKLNWLRSYDYNIDLTVYYDSISRIQYASIGTLTCTDSIYGKSIQQIDSITHDNDTVYSHPTSCILSIFEGSGDIDLTFRCDVVKTIFSNGTSKVTLRGNAGYAEHYIRSYGTIRAETLCTNIVKVDSQSTNDIYVWARGSLFANLSSIGNLYYKGNPWISQTCTGDGRVIKME